jgi:REP element-mobilizing transposase RayT
MQLKLNLNKGKRGGRRSGAGRKRIKSKGVAHRERETVNKRTPLHVNFKYVKNVRNKETLKTLRLAIQNARRHGLRVLHYSFQPNHVHLIIEANDNSILTRGMRSLTNTFAKKLNHGRIQVERYHLHVLRTPRESRNAIHYVLFNQQKHEKGTRSTVDDYSSVLCLKEGIDLVRKFAVAKKMVLRIGKVHWEPDPALSYLARKAIELI